LSEKLIERNDVIEKIKSIIKPHKTGLVSYVATRLEVKLASKLGVPLIGNGPGYETYGSKSGSRLVFGEAGVPYPVGTSVVFDAQSLAESIAVLVSSRPSIRKFVVKLDQGFSGNGNALLTLPPGKLTSEDIMLAMATFKITSSVCTWDRYKANMEKYGVLAEAFLEGGQSCPSAQGFISRNGNVIILSTHEQVLDGQEYLGCKFPANASYRDELQRHAKAVGEILAKKGQVGFFGVDFMACSDDNTSLLQNPDVQHDQIYTLEINLRQTGTTHPFFALRNLAGIHCASENLEGNCKYYISSDNLVQPWYKGKRPQDLLKLIKERNLGFNHEAKCGYIYYMFGGLPKYGQFAATCIANSPEKAESMLQQLEAILSENWCNAISSIANE